MNIELKQIPLRDIYEGYIDSGEHGVEGYDGKLDIRPPYQREYVYADKERDEVIRSVRGGYPIGVMYWAKTGPDSYEVLDGQQRTLSLMSYIDGNFSIDVDGKPRNFYNLTDAEQEEILDYPVMVYICDGTEAEKLKWFQVVNIAGEPLTKQEIRNSVYSGPWLTEAKKYFSKQKGPAQDVGGNYLSGNANRQDYLEAVLSWIADKNNETIEDYMSRHQKYNNANELWLYFTSVINWIKQTFRVYRNEMKGVDWGKLYNQFKDADLDPVELERRTAKLMEDEESIGRKKGIYEYLLTGDEHALHIRAFSKSVKRAAYEKQKGICPICNKHYEFDEMEGDHIVPWAEGGKTVPENCQMLCKTCNRRKGAR